MNPRLNAIRKIATEILQRHGGEAVMVPGAFVGDAAPPALTASQMARRWAERTLREEDPEAAKAMLDQAIAFDRYEARDALAQAEMQAQQRRSAGGKARAALRPNLKTLVAQEALRARVRRQTPFSSAQDAAGHIVKAVNAALADLDAAPVETNTIRRRIPEKINGVKIFDRDRK